MYKLVVYVPTTHAEEVRQVLRKSGAGKMGNYEGCTFSTKGFGRFVSLEGAEPFLGRIGKTEQVEEEKIETVCEEAILDSVLAKICQVHPYEEPAIEAYNLVYPR